MAVRVVSIEDELLSYSLERDIEREEYVVELLRASLSVKHNLVTLHIREWGRYAHTKSSEEWWH